MKLLALAVTVFCYSSAAADTPTPTAPKAPPVQAAEQPSATPNPDEPPGKPAADEKPTPKTPEFTYGGSADFYFSSNFNDPFNGKNSLRAWDIKDEHGPHLGLIDLWVQKRRDPVGFRLDVDFGPTARLFNAFEPSHSRLWEHLQQAYVSVNLDRSGKTYLDLGKWITPAGVEVPEPKENWLYSRGLLYTFAMPFYHTGGRVYHYFNAMDYVMVHINRGWNAVGNPDHGPGFGITGMKMVGKRWMLMGNYLGGDEAEMGMMGTGMMGMRGMGMGGGGEMMGPSRPKTSYRHLIDIAATQMPGRRLSFTHNLDFGVQSGNTWYGLSSQARYDLSSKDYLAARGEIFRDNGGLMTGERQTLGSATLGYTRFLNKYAQVRAEYRHDFAGGSEPFAGSMMGRRRSSQDTLLFATIFSY